MWHGQDCHGSHTAHGGGPDLQASSNGVSPEVSWAVWHAQEVTGDIVNNLRLLHPVGALWLAVRDADDVFDDIYETWVHDSRVPRCNLL